MSRNIDDRVNCKCFRFRVPSKIRVGYASMVESGRIWEDPLSLPSGRASAFAFAHLESVGIKARPSSSRIRWAAEFLELLSIGLKDCGILTLQNREERLFRKDGSATWNISVGSKALASAWRWKLIEKDHLGVVGRKSESTQCRLQLIMVLEFVQLDGFPIATNRSSGTGELT